MSSMNELRDQARGLVAKLDEVSNDAELSLDEKKSALDAIEADYKAVSVQIENSERASEMRAKMAGFGDAKDVQTGNQIAKFEAPAPLRGAGVKQLAAEFVASPAGQKLLGYKGNFNEKINEGFTVGLKTSYTNGSGESTNIMGEGLDANSGTAWAPAGQTPFLPGTFGPGILPDWRPGIVEQLFYEITIPDLISSFATTSPNISYLTESLDNLQANATEEGATYPFSSIELARVYSQVGKIANALTITDEAVADAATLFNFVQGRLLLSLRRQEEVQLLAGTSSSGGVGGLLSTFASNFTASSASSIYGATSYSGSASFPPAGTYGAGTPSQTISSLAYGREVVGAGTSYPDPLTVALNLKDAAVDIELAVFHAPTAHIMHPRDWQRLETAQDGNEQFMNTSFFGNVYGVSRGPVKSLWGVPVVTTPLMPAGTILTGWFDPQTVQAARREGVQMQMTNSNESDFIEGRITVRAEERLGLLCYRPTAFQLTKLVAG
jgi:Phage capsid family